MIFPRQMRVRRPNIRSTSGPDTVSAPESARFRDTRHQRSRKNSREDLGRDEARMVFLFFLHGHFEAAAALRWRCSCEGPAGIVEST